MESLVTNPGYKQWLSKQNKATKTKGEEIRLTVQKVEHWEGVWRAVRVLNPVSSFPIYFGIRIFYYKRIAVTGDPVEQGTV